MGGAVRGRERHSERELADRIAMKDRLMRVTLDPVAFDEAASSSVFTEVMSLPRPA